MTTIALPRAASNPILKVLFGSLLLAISAQIAIPLPFLPVAICLSPTIVVLMGAFLGPRLAVASVACYLVEGALGLPVFANFHSSIAWIVGPAGGYYLGFLIAAYLSGIVRNLVTSSIVGHLAIYACAAAYLTPMIGFQSAITVGVLAYIPGDILKTTVVLRMLRRA